MKKKLMSLVLSTLLLNTTACGLRQYKENQKIADDSQEAVATAQTSQAIALSEQASNAAQAHQDFENRRQYFKAIAGEFSGSFSLVTGAANIPSIEPSPAPSVSPLNAQISVSIEVENDAGSIPQVTPPTVAQYQADTSALTLSFDVVETTTSPYYSRIECLGSGVKPDPGNGTLTFTCQSSSAGAGRIYIFALDNNNGPSNALSAVQRTPKNMLERSIDTNELLLNNALSSLPMMDVEITSPFGQEFFGTLPRSGS